MISGTLALITILLILISFLVQPISIFIWGICFAVQLNSGSGDPEQRLMDFGQALLERDQAAARALGSDAMDNLITILFENIPEGTDNPMQSIFDELENIDCQISNNRQEAVCKVCINDEPNCQDVEMIVEGGLWVVHISKEMPGVPNE